MLTALSSLDTTQGPKALDAISGQPAANFGTTNTQTASAFMSAVGAQMACAAWRAGRRHARGAGRRARPGLRFRLRCASASRYGAWISGVGGLGSALGNSNGRHS